MRNPFGIQSENKFDTYDKLIEYNMANNRIIHFIVCLFSRMQRV